MRPYITMSIRELSVTNQNTITEMHVDWFNKRVQSVVDEERHEWQPTDNYLQWNACFVTLTFDQRRIRRRKSALNDSSASNLSERDRKRNDLSPEYWNVDWLYKRVCRAILGRKFNEHRSKQPLMIACADINGTRYGDPNKVQNLHIHSIWVFRKGQINLFRKAMQQIMDDPRMDVNDIDKIDIRDVYAMEPEGKKDTRLVSYTAKFLGQNATKLLVGQDLAIYPIV